MRYQKGKYQYKGRNHSLYPFPDIRKIEELKKYFSTEKPGYNWYFNDLKEGNIFEVHEIFMNSFGRNFVQTGLTDGFLNENEVKRINGFPTAYYVKAEVKGSLRDISLTTNLIKFTRKGKNPVLSFSVEANFFSDYPYNKDTGKYMNFTEFAGENRELFNKGLERFISGIGGNIKKLMPRKGSYPKELRNNFYDNWDIKSEEFDEHGFNSVSERKEIYLLQEAEKNKPKTIWNIFNKK